MTASVRHIHRLAAIFALVGGVAPTAGAAGRDVKAEVLIHARGPAGLRIDGKSAALAIEDDAEAIRFDAPLASIDTGIGVRNRHLRERLEVERFPISSLKVPRAEVKAPRDGAPTEGTAKGELSLHGVTRPIAVRYRAERIDAQHTRVHGSLVVDLRQFGIEAPSYLGLKVSPEVEVEVDASFAESGR